MVLMLIPLNRLSCFQQIFIIHFSFTGTASVARAYSGYIDSLIDKRMATAFRSFMPIDISFLSPYPDFCAFVITLSLTLILCIGVKESTRFNNIFTCLNICVVVFVTFCGWITADFNNWQLEPKEKYVVIFYQFFLPIIFMVSCVITLNQGFL